MVYLMKLLFLLAFAVNSLNPSPWHLHGVIGEVEAIMDIHLISLRDEILAEHPANQNALFFSIEKEADGAGPFAIV
jgi:hypothetical protein